MNWISKSTALKIHDEILAELGGLSGVRDESGLESALARPQQKHNYGETNVPRLAASLMYGLVQGHCYADVNKRSAFICSTTFLNDNGYKLNATAKDIYATVVAVAASSMSEQTLSDWFVKHSHQQTITGQISSMSMNVIRQQCMNYHRSNVLELLSQRGGMER